MKSKKIIILISFIALFIVLVPIQYLFIKYNGASVLPPTIPRSVQQFGTTGPDLKYAVMGDSTSIGQGAEYRRSYAYGSAEHLAKNHKVELLNVGVSGAVTKDLLGAQLNKVASYRPNVVLIAVGANDATAFTGGKSEEQSLQALIDGLRKTNPDVKIVVTGCPAMGSVPRFPAFGARQLAGLRERQINRVYQRIIAKNGLTLAPVALKTGAAFAADPTLFAADKFHPSARGYALWTPVINSALDSIIDLN